MARARRGFRPERRQKLGESFVLAAAFKVRRVDLLDDHVAVACAESVNVGGGDAMEVYACGVDEARGVELHRGHVLKQSPRFDLVHGFTKGLNKG